MTPQAFLDSLLVHYAKRHASPEAEDIWMRDMMRVVQNADRTVLGRAYTLVCEEHTERAFPLPAQLRAWIARAAELVDFDRRQHLPPALPPQERTPEQEAALEASRERVRAMHAQFHAEMAAKGHYIGARNPKTLSAITTRMLGESGDAG